MYQKRLIQPTDSFTPSYRDSPSTQLEHRVRPFEIYTHHFHHPAAADNCYRFLPVRDDQCLYPHLALRYPLQEKEKSLGDSFVFDRCSVLLYLGNSESSYE
jgi:hypothetical protein